jgi:hypothetical protein
MNYSNRKESASAARQAEEREITRILSAYGREVVERFFDMNVRTIVWANRSDGRVPVLIEQFRLYSSPGDWAFTRLMEASDLVDAARGLRKSLDTIRTWHLPPSGRRCVKHPIEMPSSGQFDAVKSNR